MAVVAAGITLFTELHPGAEKSCFSLWGGGCQGAGSGVGGRRAGGSLHPGGKPFPETLYLWPVLCHMQSMAEMMDWNPPLEVKDPGYFFDSLCT